PKRGLPRSVPCNRAGSPISSGCARSSSADGAKHPRVCRVSEDTLAATRMARGAGAWLAHTATRRSVPMQDRSIVLHYPRGWLAPVNPAHERARRDTERWLRSLGVITDAGTTSVFDAMNVGWYGGAPFPDARYEELTTIMRFFTLWIFHDEVLEGLGV